jgi:hypothetical protein
MDAFVVSASCLTPALATSTTSTGFEVGFADESARDTACRLDPVDGVLGFARDRFRQIVVGLLGQ